MKKYRLILKPIDSDNAETIRIYNNLRESCERLNIYLADFFETVEILNEKKNSGVDFPGGAELNIEFVNGRINEVIKSMEDISQSMNSLVYMEEA